MSRRDACPHRMHGSEGGFTLIEAIIAVTIGTLIVLMASGVFMVQSDFYDFLVRQSRVQDNARTVVHFVRELVPTIPAGGVVVASDDRFVVRRPQSLAVACADAGGNDLHTLMTNGIESIDASKARGVGAYTEGVPPTWDFNNGSVSARIGDTGIVPATACAAAGVDTVGYLGDFVELRNVGSLGGASRGVGDVFMVFEEFEIAIGASTLDPINSALFQGISSNGQPLVEFVSGLSSTAGFEYRVGTNWSSSVTGGSRANINAIRVTADALASAGGESSDASFELQSIIPVGR